MVRNHGLLKAALGAAFVGMLGAADASAQTQSLPLNIQLWLGGQMVWNHNPAGSPIEGGDVVHYEGDASGTGWGLAWDLTADPDPFVNGVMAATNHSAMTQTFGLMVTQPIAPALSPSSLMGGSVQGGITADGDGGTLSSLAGTAIYQAMIDGGVLGGFGDLLVDPISLTVGAFGSDSFAPESFGSMPMIPSEPGPSVATSIGILLSFSLTPGDTATFSAVFAAEQIPTPAPLALFGVAGLAALRRRR